MTIEGEEFAVAEILRVPAGSALRDFPEFPSAGTLIILTPPRAVGPRELSGFSAQVRAPGRPSRVIDYRYWQVNPQDVIGLLCDVKESSIPLGARVSFVKRRR